jgi:hypothetical protein
LRPARLAAMLMLPAGLGLLPAAAAAQARGCDYDRCALWIVHGMGSTGIVQGMEPRPAGFGTFVPRADLLAAADSPVRRHYEASRRDYRRYTVLGGVAFAALLGTVLYYLPEEEREWRPVAGVGLPLAAVAFSIPARVSNARAEDRLRQAIWLYNRALAADSGAVASGCPYDRCALRLQVRPWSDRVVRGSGAVPVGGAGSAPVAALFAGAGDSARVHYETFRTLSRRGSRGESIGLAAGLAGLVLYAASDSKTARGVAVGLLGVGYAAGHTSSYGLADAETHLERAIWFYNRTLPATPQPDAVPGPR